MVERFELKDINQLKALYLYIVYIAEEFVPQKDVNGTMEKAGLGSFFGEY